MWACSESLFPLQSRTRLWPAMVETIYLLVHVISEAVSAGDLEQLAGEVGRRGQSEAIASHGLRALFAGPASILFPGLTEAALSLTV
ncbi:hypothetical protein MPLA_1060005 [Mesorhizobium sp. ORS 3359]|nr:hypothetical protein MPLA_1060005 [Mesorhizobium sp. ORS 3359]